MAWYRWTTVHRANIPDALRASLEEYGEAVVAQILARPLTHSAEQTTGVPRWAGDDGDRRHALAWLREKHNEADRKRDISETMEVAIVLLVAIEVVPTVAGWVRTVWCWIHG